MLCTDYHVFFTMEIYKNNILISAVFSLYIGKVLYFTQNISQEKTLYGYYKRYLHKSIKLTEQLTAITLLIKLL